jgi:hypothetical protein
MMPADQQLSIGMEILEDVTNSDAANSVDVLQEDDAWIVRVTIDGRSEDQQFKVEKAARTFAEGQRLRLSMLAAQSELGTTKPTG